MKVKYAHFCTRYTNFRKFIALRFSNCSGSLLNWDRDNSDCRATGYGLDGPGIESVGGEIFRMGPNNLPVKCVLVLE
jgi:hypothetical protein